MNKFVARVWNRHWGKEEKVGVHARIMQEAVDKLSRDKGKVLSIREVKEFPSDIDSTLYVW